MKEGAVVVSSDELVKILEKFSDYLTISDPIWHGLRIVGWGFIQLLCLLVNGLEKTLDEIYTMGNFFNSGALKTFINDWNEVFWAIAGVSLALFFIRYMKNDGLKLRTGFDNFLFGLGIILLLGSAMNTMSSITFDAAKTIKGGDMTAAYSIVRANITDNLQFDENDWKTTKLEEPNKFTDNQIKYINITETIDKGGDFKSKKTKEIFGNRISYDYKGELKPKSLASGVFKWDEEYYRYSWHPFQIIFELLVLGTVLLFASFKTTRIIWELGYNKIFAMFFAFMDLTDGQRIKKITKNIFNLFFTIFAIALLIKFYLIYSSWLNNWDLSSFTRLIALLGGGWAVLDAPWIVQSILGIDAGLNSVAQNLTGLYSGLKTAQEVGNGMKKLGKNAVDIGMSAGKLAADKVLQGGAVGKGIVDGIKDGKESLEKQMDKDNKTNDGTTTLEDEMSSVGTGQDEVASVNEDSKEDSGVTLEKEMNSTEIDPSNNDSMHDENRLQSDKNSETPGTSLEKEMDSTEINSPNNSIQDENNETSGQSLEQSLEKEMNQAIEKARDLPKIPSTQDKLSQGGQPLPNMNIPKNNVSLPKDVKNHPGTQQLARDISTPMAQNSLEKGINQSIEQARSLPKIPSTLYRGAYGGYSSPNLNVPKNKVSLPEEIRNHPGTQQLAMDIERSNIPRVPDTRNVGQVMSDKVVDAQMKYSGMVGQVLESDSIRKATQRYDISRNTTRQVSDKLFNKNNKK